MPRNDLLLSAKQERRDKLFQKLGLGREQKLVIYAPTFREIMQMLIL